MPPGPDLTELPRFLDHLGDGAPASAALARRLLDGGGRVTAFRGPETTDTSHLMVRRGRRASVLFVIERGLADRPTVSFVPGTPRVWEDFRSLAYILLVWSRGTGQPFLLAVPTALDDVDLARTETAIDWVAARPRRMAAVDAVAAAALAGAHRRSTGWGSAQARERMDAETVAAMEAAARVR